MSLAFPETVNGTAFWLVVMPWQLGIKCLCCTGHEERQENRDSVVFLSRGASDLAFSAKRRPSLQNDSASWPSERIKH